MRWPTWSQALVAAAISALIALVLRRSRPTRLGDIVMPAALEFAFVASLYSIWRMAKNLPLTQADGAIDRAYDIVRFQEFLHLPSELSVQHFLLDHEWLGRLSAAYYGGLHVPALVIFLVWLFARHRDLYPHWRNALALLTAGCLFIRFVKVAPPRFLTDLGYVDLPEMYDLSVYGEAGTGLSAQFAAMPSLHVAWAAVVGFGALAASTSRWRWVGMLHLVLTMLVVAGTGHHWWLDGIVALLLLWCGLQIDTLGRRLVASVRARRAVGLVAGPADIAATPALASVDDVSSIPDAALDGTLAPTQERA